MKKKQVLLSLTLGAALLLGACSQDVSEKATSTIDNKEEIAKISTELVTENTKSLIEGIETEEIKTVTEQLNELKTEEVAKPTTSQTEQTVIQSKTEQKVVTQAQPKTEQKVTTQPKTQQQTVTQPKVEQQAVTQPKTPTATQPKTEQNSSYDERTQTVTSTGKTDKGETATFVIQIGEANGMTREEMLAVANPIAINLAIKAIEKQGYTLNSKTPNKTYAASASASETKGAFWYYGSFEFEATNAEGVTKIFAAGADIDFTNYGKSQSRITPFAYASN